MLNFARQIFHRQCACAHQTAALMVLSMLLLSACGSGEFARRDDDAVMNDSLIVKKTPPVQNRDTTQQGLPNIEPIPVAPDSTSAAEPLAPKRMVKSDSLRAGVKRRPPRRAASDSTVQTSNITKQPKTLTDATPNDTTLKGRDSTKVSELSADSLGGRRYETALDSLADSPADSSARIEQFLYRRIDSLTANVLEKPIHPLFVPKVIVARRVVIDSLQETVTIREQIDSVDVKIPTTIELAAYRDLRWREALRQNFRDIAAQQFKAQNKDALSDMLGKITKVQIYIPGAESSFFSTLFGPPTVSLQVSGNIDIRAALQLEENKNPNVALGAARQTAPNFDQQVQLNLSGMIGDKLTISADWNTQRPFEFENQLKLTYRGYEDDIVQSIEAGNVSLALPTSLIGSSQALFGVKTKFQLAGFSLTAIASQQRGRSDVLSVQSGAQETTVQLQAWEYDFQKHFFISNYFASRWDRSFSTTQPNTIVQPDPQGRQITRVEVWRAIDGAAANIPGRRTAIALLNYGDEPFDREKIETGFAPPQDRYYDVAAAESAALLNRFRVDTTDISGLIPQGSINFVGDFVLMQEGQDYVLDKTLGYISFRANIAEGDVIAVSYQLTGAGAPPLTVGDFSNDSSKVNNRRLVLKLVKPRQVTSTTPGAWLLMMKNIYSLRAQNIQPDGFGLRVVYQNPGQPDLETLPGTSNSATAPRPLVTALGIDRFNPTRVPPPDGLFDFIPGITIDAQRGLLIFPYLRPFDRAIRDELAAQNRLADTASLAYPEIYDRQPIDARDAGTKNRYQIRATFKSTVQSTYQLGFNIVQGSVRVTSRGAPLTEGADYTVDYQSGQVNILRADALDPGANLRIEFEKNDLVLLAARTIVGARGEYIFNENFKIGGTFLQYAERPLADKVRIGDEPIFNRIYGFDMQFKTPLRWLTRAIDALPLISTKEESELSLNAEYAQVLPGTPGELRTALDPEGVSYIDDFEGSKQIITLGLEGAQWSLSSAPLSIPSPSLFQDSLRNGLRANLAWYRLPQGDSRNPPTRVIFPNRRAAREELNVRPLFMEYNPRARGAYNFSLDFLRSIATNQSPDSAWGGMMRFFPQFTRNLQDANIEFIEFWFKYDTLGTAFAPNERGTLHIDLGTISEDVIPNGQLNTEDGMPITSAALGQNDDPLAIGTDGYGRFLRNVQRVNGAINTGDLGTEDVGLDGLSNTEERARFAAYLAGARAILGANSAALQQLESDPSGDDFVVPNLSRLERSAGLEGNSVQGVLVGGRIFPDTEDLDGNQVANRQNDFYRYTIPIVPSELRDPRGARGQFVVSGGVTTNDGWVQFRVPLSAFTSRVGNIGDFRNIAYARIWVDGFRQPARLGFATLDFVGSQWRRSDSLSSIASINIEENSAIYAIPPGIQRARDRQRVDQTILANEQSLVLIGRAIPADSIRSAFRNFAIGQGNLNLNPYNRLRAFIHGGRGVRYNPNNPQDPNNTQAVIRFGDDVSQNFYEYRLPVVPSPPVEVPPSPDDPRYEQAQRALWPSENEVDIDLRALSAFKLRRRDSLGRVVERLPNGHEIVVQGNPSLGTIRFFLVGIRNPSPVPIDSAEIWVNELRVSGYAQENGWAVRANATLKLADLATLTASVQRQTADFHGLDVRLNQLANQNNSLSWNIGATVRLDKFLPAEDGWTIPLTYEHSENLAEPKFQPGQNDILLQAAIDRAVADTIANGASQDVARTYGELLRQQAQSLNITDRLSIPRIQKTKPSDFWLMRYTLDRLGVSYSSANTNSRSPVQEVNSNWSWLASLDYSLPLPQNLFIEPLRFLTGVPILEAYKDLKFYYAPQTLTVGLNLQRQRTQIQLRGQPIQAPVSTFFATRTMGFNYKVTETFSMNYTANISSSLNLIAFDTLARADRSDGEIINRVLQDLSRFTLGRDQTYAQNISMDWKPKLIDPLNWIGLTLGYNAQYSWRNPQPDAIVQLGNSVSTVGTFRLQATLRLRDIGKPAPSGNRFGSTVIDSFIDTTQTSGESNPMLELLKGIGGVLKVFTNFDQISIGFNVTNNLQNAGILGGTGFFNFFPFNLLLDRSRPLPPSAAYQLGFSDDPGERILLSEANAGLLFTDIFSQANTLNASTTWAIAENFRVDFTLQSSWTDSRNRQFRSTDGSTTQLSFNGTQTRSFISLFRSEANFQDALRDASGNPRSDNAGIAAAFQDGFEPTRLPNILSSLLRLDAQGASRIPLPNWRVSWTGLERISFLADVFSSMALEHAYTSTFTSSYDQPNETGRLVTTSAINEQLAPLVGVNIQWKFGMTTNASYGTTRTINLLLANNSLNITRGSQINLSVGFQKQGLKIPLDFWIFKNATLDNTLDVSFNFTLADEETQSIVVSGANAGTNAPIGTTRISFEPRVSYALSSRVTASFFWRFTRIAPKATGGNIFESTKQDVGFNFRISVGS
jgi:cell surface protein SprA